MPTGSDILEYEPGDLTCIVEGGLRLSTLQSVLDAHEQRLSLDPPGDPTLAECLTGDLSGPLRHRFGTMRDLVLGVTVVLPDGTRASSGGKVVKNVAGYDLGKLFCGSRGRLGSVERLALRLHPLPAAARTVVTSTPTGSALHRSQLVPSAVDIAEGRMHVLFEGSERAVDAQLHALGGEECDPWAELRLLQVSLPGRVRWDGKPAPLVRPGPRVAYVEEAREPALEPVGRARAGGDVQPELIADCVHCGFCLPACPTYSLWHEEMDSPRGRIYLMQGLVDGTIELTDTVVEHFDRCLGCMACVPACPSGVKYDRLIEQTRAPRRGAPSPRAGRASPARRDLRGRAPPPAPAGGAPLPQAAGTRAARALKRIAPPWAAPEWPPEHLPGDGPKVALVAGCVAERRLR